MMPPDQIVGTAAASQLLGLKQATVSKLCRQGKFPHAVQDKQGHPWHIPLDDIEKYQHAHHKRTIPYEKTTTKG